MFTKNEVSRGLEKAITCLGKTDWYLVLHYNRFRKIINCLSRQTIRGASGLEIGVWPGYLGIALKSLGYKVTGTDLEPERLGELGVPVIKLDLNSQAIPFPDNTFDFVTLSEVIEHIHPESIKNALGEINRVLLPGGVLIFSTPNKTRLRTMFQKLRNQAREHGHGHEREYALDEIIRLVEQTKLNIVNAQTESFYAGVGKYDDNKYYYPIIKFLGYPRKISNLGKIILYLLLKTVPKFRDSLLITAKKSS